MEIDLEGVRSLWTGRDSRNGVVVGGEKGGCRTSRGSENDRQRSF